MINWRKNLGGAIGTLGTGIATVGTASTIPQFNDTGTISKVTFYMIIAGGVISCFGKAVTAFFAADHTEISKAMQVQDDKIQQIANDTSVVLRDPKP